MADIKKITKEITKNTVIENVTKDLSPKENIKKENTDSNNTYDSDESKSTNSSSSDGENGDCFQGEVLLNRYILIKRIGCGAFASVWLSFDVENEKYYAIKIQEAKSYHDGKEEVYFLKELQKYDCKYISNMIDYFVITGNHIQQDYYELSKQIQEKEKPNRYVCMVFELMACHLFNIIRKGKYRHGLPIPIVKRMIKQVLTALDIVHNKLKTIHTDVRLENILICGIDPQIQILIDKLNEFNIIKKITEVKLEYAKENNIDISNKNQKKKLSKTNPKYKILKKVNGLIQSKYILYSHQNSENNSVSENDVKKDMNELFINKNEEYSSDYEECSDYISTSQSEETHTSDDDEIETSSSENRLEVISDKYINNCCVKLTDFGLIQYMNDELDPSIQTRYYRSPEIILGYPFNETCDLWSLACITYELLTGEILFHPSKDDEFSRDEQHLYWLQELLGPFPKTMIQKSKRKNKFFDDDCRLKILKTCGEIERESLKKIFEDTTKFTREEIKELCAFLTPMLKYDPGKRATVADCLQNQWLANVEI